MYTFWLASFRHHLYRWLLQLASRRKLWTQVLGGILAICLLLLDDFEVPVAPHELTWPILSVRNTSFHWISVPILQFIPPSDTNCRERNSVPFLSRNVVIFECLRSCPSRHILALVVSECEEYGMPFILKYVSIANIVRLIASLSYPNLP